MKRRTTLIPRTFVVLSVLVLALTAIMAQTTAPTIYVKAGHLFDATSDNLRDNMVLVVEGERITKVAPASQVMIPAGATVVDLSQDWVLPGLIDCHTHLEARADRYDPIWDVKRTPFTGGFNGVVNANKTLQAGFTSVRDVGSQPFFAVDLRRAIDEGQFPGPRVVASGPGISITGGHGDMNGFAPGVENRMISRRTRLSDCRRSRAGSPCGPRADQIRRGRDQDSCHGRGTFTGR